MDTVSSLSPSPFITFTDLVVKSGKLLFFPVPAVYVNLCCKVILLVGTFLPTWIFVKWPFCWDLVYWIDPHETDQTYDPLFLYPPISHSLYFWTWHASNPTTNKLFKGNFQASIVPTKMCKFKDHPHNRRHEQLNRIEPEWWIADSINETILIDMWKISHILSQHV